jgi:murein DD-endopeptidase MepM/ murein hydrolase activator NlpD
MEATVVPALPSVSNQLQKNLEKTELLSYVIKPGDTFYGILARMEISSDRAREILNSLKPLGLPSLFPGDSLLIKKSEGGEIKKLELISRSQHRYQVNYSDSLIEARKKPIEITSYICMVNGILESSLSEDLYKYGISDVITWKFADIFAWDINFFLDPRKGDTFQIIFEQKYADGRFVGYGEILAARYVNNGREFLAFGVPDKSGKYHYYDKNGKSVQKQFLRAPLKYSRISSKFSYNRKHPILGIVRPHLGIDYAAPVGTPVSAAADGRVSFSGWKGGYGKMVILSHGGAYQTYYGHLNSISSKIRNGAVVKQGDQIGTVGSTGLSTGPHLDYRMKRHGKFVNPLTISPPSSGTIAQDKRMEFQNIKQACLTAMEKRFPQQAGLHILEIEKPVTGEPVVHQINRETGLINGINTNS